ncbi:MAG: SMP-30/gluconolactonase/LRE family protein [Gemmatimonadota bacterium]
MTRLLRALLICAALPAPLAGQVTADAPFRGNPIAVVDLRTDEGIRLMHGQWRYSDVRIVEVTHHAPGPDLRPSGPPNRTYDIEPKAGAQDFDDSAWETLRAPELETRRGHGRLSYNWYRTSITVPERIGNVDPTGKALVLEVVVDDYAEVWVNGRLPAVLGQTGGQLARGFNAPNRVVLTRCARPGEIFTVAIFGVNGPVSNPPGNFIWVRSATLDLYSADAARIAEGTEGSIRRLDRGLDGIVPADAKIEKLAGGFQFLEGPVWVREGGYLLFSDPNANRIYRWTPNGEVSVYRTKSGYAGVDIGEYHQPGSNGLTLDSMGRLTVDQHGERRVIRIERTGAITVLADRYEGHRLNSPNDLVYRSDGTLYFTDPPFGLPKAFGDSKKELPFSGVYMVRDGRTTLLTRELAGPNGLAFSPDERTFYVDNWDPARKVIMRYDVRADGTLANGRVFLDVTRTAPGDDAWDGIKVDRNGNVYAAGPGGIYVLSPEGRHLGTIVTPEHAANFAWGDDDNRTLFITASTGLYRIRLNVPGIAPSFDGTAPAMSLAP